MQTSAAAFTKGLLDLEGSALTPILVRWDSMTYEGIEEACLAGFSCREPVCALFFLLLTA